MIKIFILIILSNYIFGSNNYYIQLASFKSIERLQKSLLKIPHSLFQNINVVKNNKWYILFTINKQSHSSIIRDIILYKIYFKSAIISKSKILEEYKSINLNNILSLNLKKKKIKNEYYIQLGSFMNSKILKNTLSRIPYYIYRNITIMKQDKWYIPMILDKKSYSSVQNDIYLYKKYFEDAISTKSRTLDKNEPIIFNLETNRFESKFKKSNNKNINIIAKQVVKKKTRFKEKKIKPTEIFKTYTKNRNISLKDSFKNKIFYMTYKSKSNKSSLLIKLTFKENIILYKPIISNIGLTEANYTIKDNKLFMYTDVLNMSSIYSIIEKRNSKFLLVSSWGDEGKISTLRYYFTLKDAKEYLGYSVNSKLSRILETNDFTIRLNSN